MHSNDFAKMTKGFMKEQELPTSKLPEQLKSPTVEPMIYVVSSMWWMAVVWKIGKLAMVI